MLAMVVNENTGSLAPRGVPESIASMLAPTGKGVLISRLWPDHPHQPTGLGPLVTQPQHPAPFGIIHTTPAGDFFHRTLTTGANIILVQRAYIHAWR